MTLPRKRSFITSLISTLQTSSSSSTTTPTSNPLKQATPDQKSLLLTLHVLFPNELLSALDLLDRDLVTRYLPNSSPSTVQVAEESMSVEQTERLPATTSTEAGEGKEVVYYVRSAQQGSSNPRFRDPVATTTCYEVRTLAWSCSCPAFIFSAFPAGGRAEGNEGNGGMAETVVEGEEKDVVEEKEGDREWSVGGLSLGQDVPMCKHLLACVLAERGGFADYVKTKHVSVEELAGWAAGWGG